MAEIMVLVLFTLLLALADVYRVKTDKISELQKQLAALEALIASADAGISITDIIQRLERQKEQLEALQRQVDRQKELEAKAAALEEILKSAGPGKDAASERQRILSAIERGAAAMKENENLRGQNVQLSEQIKRSGKGNEFPSCWATVDGKPESIFETTLTPGGITIHDRALPHRAQDQQKLPLAKVKYDSELSREQFSDQIRPLYAWSVANSCRFYILRYTGDRSVVNPELVNALDGFFYPDSPLMFRAGSR